MSECFMFERWCVVWSVIVLCVIFRSDSTQICTETIWARRPACSAILPLSTCATTPNYISRWWGQFYCLSLCFFQKTDGGPLRSASPSVAPPSRTSWCIWVTWSSTARAYNNAEMTETRKCSSCGPWLAPRTRTPRALWIEWSKSERVATMRSDQWSFLHYFLSRSRARGVCWIADDIENIKKQRKQKESGTDR